MPYRRSIFLINHQFQLRFSFYVCSWLIALGFAYPLIISNLFDYFIRYMAADPAGPALARLEQTREELLWLLISMQIILVILTFLISVFMSHKIAGPIYKLRAHFKKVATGHFHEMLTFRENDYFHDIIDDYNEMILTIGRTIEHDRSVLASVTMRLEDIQSKIGETGKAELQNVVDQLKNAIVQPH